MVFFQACSKRIQISSIKAIFSLWPLKIKLINNKKSKNRKKGIKQKSTKHVGKKFPKEKVQFHKIADTLHVNILVDRNKSLPICVLTVLKILSY